MLKHHGLSRDIFTIIQINDIPDNVHHGQLSVFILIQNKVLHPRHTNEMTAGRFPPLGGCFLTTWSFGRAAL